MIPKTIHLCWFSGDPYPVEIKVCLDSWKRVLPEYTVRLWTYKEAKAIGIGYIIQALECQKWAFAADVVRFYAVWKYGGVYMDSDIFLYRRFDEFMTGHSFVTFNEHAHPERKVFGLQAAFFIGEAGNEFCRMMVDYYRKHNFILEDGTMDQTISPMIMRQCAIDHFGYKNVDEEQCLGDIAIYPTKYLSPSKSYARHAEAFGVHRIYGSWRKRKWGRRLEIRIKHIYHVIKYALLKK